LSKVSVTSAMPIGGRFSEPAKMTSSMPLPRSLRADCSPITHLMASTTFDFPQPFGPTTQVMPASKLKTVRSTKDLKPWSCRLLMRKRSLDRSASGSVGTGPALLDPAAGSVDRSARTRTEDSPSDDRGAAIFTRFTRF
jgi:hypothetical protein